MNPSRRETIQLLASAAPTALGIVSNIGATVTASAQQAKPNIVFILMDNLGYGELGVYGGGITRGAPTPRIDKLASEGTRLTNFNVEAQCTPSRSAIMTGRFSIRSGTHSVPIGEGLEGLTQWEVTIAELLSGAGYATAAFGKWHACPTIRALMNGTASRARQMKPSGLRRLRRKRPACHSNKSWKATKARRVAQSAFMTSTNAD
jgi:arylsulfatase A-like enzyme